MNGWPFSGRKILVIVTGFKKSCHAVMDRCYVELDPEVKRCSKVNDHTFVKSNSRYPKWRLWRASRSVAERRAPKLRYPLGD